MPLVVILDDRATNRHIFSRLAHSIDPAIEARAFGEPVEALAWLSQPGNMPDLVVTDFKMPGMNGAEFTRNMRALPHLEDVPVVVVTVYEDRDFRLDALQAGATDFLTSPVDHREFVTRARNLLMLRRQQLALKQQLASREHSWQAALRDSSERLAQVIDTVPAIISATDARGRLIFRNAGHAALHGSAGALPRAVEDQDENAASRDGHAHLDRLVFRSNEALPSFEEEVFDALGRRRVLLTTKAPLRDGFGEVASVLTTSLDITARKEAEAQITHVAQHDTLTGLPNRLLFSDRLHRELASLRREGRGFALLMLDLDDFRSVNELFGQAAGDRLLNAVGRRLRALLRESDTAARLGGDEFAVLQTDIGGPGDVANLAARIKASLAEPGLLDALDRPLEITMGVTLAPEDGEDPEILLRNAELAMYNAREEGGGCWRFYSAEMDAKARELFELDIALRRAVERNEFVLHYQPQIDMRTGRIIGAEALVRWERPGQGMVSPGLFLPRLEETGLIVPMSEWVLREACAEAQAWTRAGLPPLKIGVNVSPVQLKRQSLCDIVPGVLRETGLAPHRLELELTENVLMDNSEVVARDLARLRRLGVRFALDDFGTGYSSFRYVKNLPVDRLKIDQYFIRHFGEEASDLAIVQAIVGLAHSLGFEVIAEGVETMEQMALLVKLGCPEGQGYLFSRPLPADQFVAFARANLALAMAG